MRRGTQDPALRQYLQEIGSYPLLSREDEAALARRIRRDGDPEAKRLMVLSNLRLVVRVAQGFVGHGLDLLDLVEEGNLGLLHAVEKFDVARGFRFSTYATWWIKKAIRRAAYSSVRTVRIPTYMVEIVARAKQAQAQLHDELGRDPTMEEVAEALHLTDTRAQLLHQVLACEATRIHEVLTDVRDSAAAPPDDVVFDRLEAQTLAGLLKTVDEREARILTLRFGLGEDRPMTLREVGRQVGLSRERVRVIEKSALEKLRTALRNAGYG